LGVLDVSFPEAFELKLHEKDLEEDEKINIHKKDDKDLNLIHKKDDEKLNLIQEVPEKVSEI
jgi:hypothetical protein